MPEQKSFLPKLSSFRFVDEFGTVHVSVQHKEWIPCCQRSSQRPVNIAYYYSIKRPNERNVTRTIFFSASSSQIEILGCTSIEYNTNVYMRHNIFYVASSENRSESDRNQFLVKPDDVHLQKFLFKMSTIA